MRYCFLCAVFLASIPVFGQSGQPSESHSASAVLPDAPSLVQQADTGDGLAARSFTLCAKLRRRSR
jgi:hypothetical protein